MLESIIKINQAVNGFIWGVPAMICIIGVGLLLSVRTRFIQVRKFGAALKNTIGKIFDKTQAKDGSMSPFQAVCTALAGTVGTGNIAGVRHVYQIFRGYAGNPFPGKERKWRICWRSNVLY